MAKSHKTSRQLYVPRIVDIGEGPGGFEDDDFYASEPQFIGMDAYGAPFRVMPAAVQIDALER